MMAKAVNAERDFVADVDQNLIEGTASTAVVIGDMVDAWEHRKVEVHLHIWGRSVEGDADNFCAIFQSATCEVLEGNATAIGNALEWNGTVHKSPCDRDDAVFVCVVEVLEEQEGGNARRLPAIVGLQPLDRCPNRTVPLEVSQFPEGTSEVLWPLTYREGQRFSLGRGLRPGLRRCKPKDRMVETSPEILKTITSNQTPLLKRRLLSDIKASRMAGGISISFEGDAIGFSLTIEEHFCLDGFEVLVRPTEFEFGTVEEVDHEGSSTPKKQRLKLSAIISWVIVPPRHPNR